MFHLTSIRHFNRLRRWRYLSSKKYGLMVGNVHICNENRNITLLKLRINVYNCFRTPESLRKLFAVKLYRYASYFVLGVFFVNMTKHNCDHEYFVLRSAGVYQIGLTNGYRCCSRKRIPALLPHWQFSFLTAFFMFLLKRLGGISAWSLQMGVRKHVY